MNIQYAPAILLLGIYARLEKLSCNCIPRDRYRNARAALLIIAENWKQPKNASVVERYIVKRSNLMLLAVLRNTM